MTLGRKLALAGSIILALPLLAFAALLVVFYASDPGPPNIFQNIRCDENNWRNSNCSVAINKIIQQEFPIGTSVSALTTALNDQGFKHDGPAIVRCTNPGDPTKIGEEEISCPSWDRNWNPKNRLFYHWGKFPCGKSVQVIWSTDKTMRISHIEAGYDFACL